MVLTKKKNLFLFKNKIKKDSTQRDISCSPVLSRSELGKEDFLHCYWTLSSWVVVTTSSGLYIQSSAQWPVTHLNDLIFLFLRNILFWNMSSSYPLYTWTYDTPMSAGEGSILEYTPVWTLPVFRVHVVEPPDFARTLYFPFRLDTKF